MIFLTCPSCETIIKLKWVNEGDQIVCYKCKTTSTVSRSKDNKFYLEEEFFDDLEDIVDDIDFEFDNDFDDGFYADENFDEGLMDDFDLLSDEGVEFVASDEDLDRYGPDEFFDIDEEFPENNLLEDEFGESFEEYVEEDIDAESVEFAIEEGEFETDVDFNTPIHGYDVSVEYEDDEDFEDLDEFDDDEDFYDDDELIDEDDDFIEDDGFDVEIITED